MSARPVLCQKTDDSDDVVRVSTDLLLFPIRVRDKNGLAVAGLSNNDFVLKDEDHATTGIYLTPGADRVALMFALDQSGSLRDVIAQQRETAIGLFERFGNKSTVAVMHFADTASLAVPFQRDTVPVRESFDVHASANAHTAIFDAAIRAISEFSKLPHVRAERRIVILISDGLDNASRTAPNEVVKAANDNRVSFYVVHLPLFEPIDGRLGVRPPTKGFRELAEKTGGKYFLVGDRRSALSPQKPDLGPIFKAIEEDLKSQYLLGFYVNESSKDGRKHELSLSVLNNDIKYSVGQLGYSRSHKFSINLKPGDSSISQ